MSLSLKVFRGPYVFQVSIDFISLILDSNFAAFNNSLIYFSMIPPSSKSEPPVCHL